MVVFDAAAFGVEAVCAVAVEPGAVALLGVALVLPVDAGGEAGAVEFDDFAVDAA